MKLSACIVVYNGYDEALKAAQTVLHCTRRYPVTLYLVDNASPCLLYTSDAADE